MGFLPDTKEGVMASSRNELRDHLLAALEAAPELPPEDRAHLADVFLDNLDKDFQLVPRSQTRGERSPLGAEGRMRPPFSGYRPWWPLPGIAAFLLAAFLIVSALTFSVHHAPVFLFVILFFLAFRFLGPWRGRGRRFGRGPIYRSR
jgi:hypothetical protein